MGKGKSVLLIVLVTIVLAGLLFIGFTPSFAVGVSDFGSLLSNVDLGTDLGGGYTTVYYPEGVMSASDYAIEDDETQADYTQYKGIYLSNENYDADTQQVTEEFSSEFNKAYAALSYRYEQMGFVNASVVKENDYTIRVTIPHLSDDTVLDTVFTQLSYSGSLHLSDSEITTSNAERRAEVWDSSLVSSAGVASAGDQGYAVTINFTAEGRAKFAELTAGMVSSSDSSSSSSSSGTLYIYVGMNQIITVSVSEEMDQDTIYISGSFTTREAAQSIASTINSVLNEDDVFDLNINYSYLYEFAPTMGENTAAWVAAAVGALFLAAIIVSLVKFKGMGLAFTYGFLTWLLALLLCVSLIGGIVVDFGGVLMIVLSAAVMAGFSYYAYNNIRKEFSTGKTLTASIKSGFKKSIALTIDVHLVLALAALVLWLVSTGTVAFMSLIFLIGTVLSGLVTLLVTRFYLYMFMAQPKNKIAFCNFRREEAEDDE